jgi:hypothetical protein
VALLIAAGWVPGCHEHKKIADRHEQILAEEED